MTTEDFSKEIKKILEYPREVSKRVVAENREDIIGCLKYFNAFDDWGHSLSFIHKSSEGRQLRVWEVFMEASINMGTALIQSVHGLYKSSLMSLRNCLETVFLMVFYSYPENDKEYDDFWDGKVDPPMFKQIRKFLFDKKEFQLFDSKYRLEQDIKDEYSSLSSYIHSRGYDRFESHFRTPREKRTEIFGSYVGFDPSFMREISSCLAKIFEISSIVFMIRYPSISMYFKKPELIDQRLSNIIKTLPKERVEQLLNYYGISPAGFWESFLTISNA